MTGLAPTAAGRPHARRLGHRDVVVIAAPIMLSNATTPLVGYVDTMVIGQLGQAALIGGVGVAANIFSFLYWLFAFLRMGTTGLTAQAEGAGDATEVLATLARAVLIAVSIGVVIIAAQHAIAWGAFRFMGASPAVEAAARTYFDIRIWATPAGLVNFALVGWFIGLGKAHVAFWLQLLLNAINLVLAYVLVAGFGLAIAGVGYAVLVAEVVAALAGLAAI